MTDPRGALTFMETERHVPFEIKRVFYIYGVPAGESRGVHAHRRLHQVLICLSGGFEVAVDDGRSREVHRLDRPSQGLYVPPLIWTSMSKFDPGTVCLVLTSDYYDESDHVLDYSLFLSLRRRSVRRTVS